MKQPPPAEKAPPTSSSSVARLERSISQRLSVSEIFAAIDQLFRSTKEGEHRDLALKVRMPSVGCSVVLPVYARTSLCVCVCVCVYSGWGAERVVLRWT